MKASNVSLDNSARRLLIALSVAAVATATPVLAQVVSTQPTAGQSVMIRGGATRLPQPTAQPAKPQTTASAPAEGQVIRPILHPRPIDTDHPMEYGASFNSEVLSEQATHITVGRSIFVDTKHRLARVYITNPEIIDSYTASPNQVVITAKKAGSSTLILWDETGESKSYLVSSDLNVDMLADSIKQALPLESIKVVGNETRVVLTGTVATQAIAEAAVKIASLYSKEVSNSLVINSARVKQIRLEVKIVEVDRSKINSFGFNFFSEGGNNSATTSTGQYTSTMMVTPATPSSPKTVTVGNPLNFSLYNSRLNIGATLQDLETMQVAQILAEPNITTMSGEKASFLAGGEFPFPVVQGSSTGGTSVSISFRPYGVKLDFTPLVNNDGTIDLKVAPEVSALDFTNAVTIAGYTIPALSTRRADTEVVLKSGQTFAISGLLDRRTSDLYSKTPGVASVPILGQLFKSKAVTHSDSELIVIVTPVIVDPVNEGTATPAEAQRPIPMLNRGTFDKDLPSGAKKP